MKRSRSKIATAYLASVSSHDWDTVSLLLTKDVVRTGPYGDTFVGRDDYVKFLSNLMPTLLGYHMEIERIIGFQKTVVAQLTETVIIDGKAKLTPEALVFDLTDEGLIARIGIYIQRLSNSQ